MKKSITTLPADIYLVVNKTNLIESDRKIITMLYQPIIGYTSVSLYFTLIDEVLWIYSSSFNDCYAT